MSFTVLAVQPWYPSNCPTFFAEAMERIGCRVIRIGPAYFSHMGLQWPAEDLPKIDIGLPRESVEWHLPHLVDRCTREYAAPDLLFLGEENYQTQVIPETRIPSVLYSCDGWPNNYARATLWQPTLAYTGQPLGNAIHPQKETPEPWRFLPGAAAPWLHNRFNTLDRKVDFCLFASMYNKRPELCQQLIERGFNVACGQRTNKEYVRGYNLALATLHNPGHMEIKWRWWESTAMGCINLSEYCPLLPQLGYLEHEHYLPIPTEFAPEYGDRWPTAETLAENIRWLRSNQNRAREMADNAWRVTFRRNLYYNRIYRIFSDLGMNKLAEQTEEIHDTLLKENGL